MATTVLVMLTVTGTPTTRGIAAPPSTSDMFLFTAIPGGQVGIGVGVFMVGTTITTTIPAMLTITGAIADMGIIIQVIMETMEEDIGMAITMAIMMDTMLEEDITTEGTIMADIMAEDMAVAAIPEAEATTDREVNRVGQVLRTMDTTPSAKQQMRTNQHPTDLNEG